jgi:hypothetical protein
MKFTIIFLLSALGQGLGAWNIQNIARKEVLKTAISTISCIVVQQLVLYHNYTTKDVSGVIAFSIGSTVGIISTVFISTRKKEEK